MCMLPKALVGRKEGSYFFLERVKKEVATWFVSWIKSKYLPVGDYPNRGSMMCTNANARVEEQEQNIQQIWSIFGKLVNNLDNSKIKK